MTEHTESYKVGGVNVKKLITQLGKYDGSNYCDLIKELIDNGYDWNANKVEVKFNLLNKTIIIKDNGNGMNKMAIQNFTELYSDNTSENGNIDGKFGIGCKKACAVLSQLNKVFVETVHNKIRSQITINYNELLQTKDSYSNSINVTAEDTTDKNYTEIVITCNDTIIIEYFKNLSNSSAISDYDNKNLQYELAKTYSPRLFESKKLFVTFEGERTTEIFPFDLINDNDSENYIYKKIKIELYNKGKNIKPLFVIKDGGYTKIWKNKSIGFENKGLDSGCIPINASFTLEFCFPKECRKLACRKKHTSREFVCASDKDLQINCIEILKSQFKLTDKFSDINKELKNLEIKRNNKILGCLPIESKNINNSTDHNKKAEVNNILKRVSFNSNSDTYINLTQETKSKVDWSVCSSGIKEIIFKLLKEFVESEIKDYLNKPPCISCHPNIGDIYINDCDCPDPPSPDPPSPDPPSPDPPSPDPPSPDPPSPDPPSPDPPSPDPPSPDPPSPDPNHIKESDFIQNCINLINTYKTFKLDDFKSINNNNQIDPMLQESLTILIEFLDSRLN
jgi:hypothetical protein